MHSRSSLENKMASFHILLLVAIIIATHAPPNWGWKKGYLRDRSAIGKSNKVQARIVGGMLATFGQAPYQVRLEVRDPVGTGWTLCGGALLNFKGLRFILTAAHCLWIGPTANDIAKADHIDVVGADINLGSYSPREQWFKVQHAVIHEDYDARYVLNDLGLLFLDRYAHESLGLSHVELPEANWEDPQYCLLAGFGSQVFGEHFQEDLHIIEVPVIPWKTCKQLKHFDKTGFGWTTFLGPKEFCVGNEHPGTFEGPCSGDSGGGAICYNFTKQYYYVAGVASYVINRVCGDPNSAAVYTRVTSYIDWIKGYAQGWLDVHGNGNPYQNGSYDKRAELKS